MDESWFEPIERWLAERNICLLPVQVDMSGDFDPKGWHIITGASGTYKDTLHSVVGKDGVVVHDPNPESKGPLKNFKYFEMFQVLDPAKIPGPHRNIPTGTEASAASPPSEAD